MCALNALLRMRAFVKSALIRTLGYLSMKINAAIRIYGDMNDPTPMRNSPVMQLLMALIQLIRLLTSFHVTMEILLKMKQVNLLVHHTSHQLFNTISIGMDTWMLKLMQD